MLKYLCFLRIRILGKGDEILDIKRTNLVLTPQETEFIKELIIKNEFIIRAQIKSVLQESYPQNAEECFGEICLLACNKVALLKSHENPSAWLVVATRNVAVNMARKLFIKTKNALNNEISDIPHEEAGYEDVIYKIWLENNSIKKLLDTLTAHEREIYELIYKEKLTSKQVAIRLGISDSTVRNLNANIKAKIKKAIKNHDF